MSQKIIINVIFIFLSVLLIFLTVYVHYSNDIVFTNIFFKKTFCEMKQDLQAHWNIAYGIYGNGQQAYLQTYRVDVLNYL